MSTLTITEFLEARIEEDEARAGSGWARLGDSRWETDNYGRDFLTPSAVLAECAAKRAVIKIAESTHDEIQAEWGGGETVSEDGWQADNLGTELVQTLAAVYSTHPGYRQDWAL